MNRKIKDKKCFMLEDHQFRLQKSKWICVKCNKEDKDTYGGFYEPNDEYPAETFIKENLVDNT